MDSSRAGNKENAGYDNTTAIRRFVDGAALCRLDRQDGAFGLYRHTIGLLVESRRVRLAVLAGVPLVWIAMLHIGPILQMANISLLANYPPQPDKSSEYTLANYALFFSDRLYFLPFVRSLIFAAVVTISTLVIVYPVAYYVAKVVQPKNRMRALLLLLIPFWAGELIRTFSVIMLLANRGALNVLLREFGFIDRPIPMLYTFFSLSFGVIYLLALYMLLPLYSAIEKIPTPLIHAAADLGAGPSSGSAGSSCRFPRTASSPAAASST